MNRRVPTSVAVIVPAHNEEELLPACLDALHRAAESASVPVHVVVVVDSCTDTTELIARAWVEVAPEFRSVVRVAAASVGVARAVGASFALARVDPATCWLMTTDADSAVPDGWIRQHVAHAERGAEVVAGTVEVGEWADWPPDVPDRYREQYRATIAGDRHEHIHGANLGLWGTTYLDLGGFAALPTGEDAKLVRAAEAARRRVVFALDATVTTSSRATARAPQGFGAYLHQLASP